MAEVDARLVQINDNLISKGIMVFLELERRNYPI